MRFATAFLDDVRERVTLSAIVGRAVQWDKRKTNPGKRDYWACCPFHNERSPSFHVDDRRNSYHCFGCGVNGDCFRFLMEHEGKTFVEAVEELANLAGLALPESTPESRAIAARRLTLIEANDKAAVWYSQQLAASRETVEYVERRGISWEEVKRFRLGFAPDRNGILNAGLGDADDLVAAGLLGRSEDGRLYDRFRNRLMFPILNAKGEAIAFTARALAEGQEPKYLNSPETEIFEKGATLYNGAAAREAAWEGARLVCVEGSIDVIAACRIGVAAVAPLGTALTDKHIALMKRATDCPIICLDGDAAGRKAAHRAIDLILPFVGPEFTAKFAELPEGQDPDSMARRSAGGFAQVLEAAMPLSDALWRREIVGIAPAVPEQRAKLEASLRTALRLIGDSATRRAYGENFKDRLATLGQRQKVYRSNSFSQHSTSPSASRLANGFQHSTGMSLKDAIMISAIVSAPLAAVDNIETLSMNDGLSVAAMEVVAKLLACLAEAPERAIAEVMEAAGLVDQIEEALAKAAAAGVDLVSGGVESAAAMAILTPRRH